MRHADPGAVIPANVEVRSAAPSDAPSLARLANSLYARKVDSRYFTWQFWQSPFPSPMFVAASHAGDIVGALGYQRRTTFGRPCPPAWAIDIMVDLAYQRRGVLRALAAHAEETLSPRPPALVVMANERSRSALMKLGWSQIARIRTSVASASAPRPTGRLSFEHTTNWSAWPLASKPYFLQSGRVSTSRDPEFLAWRYHRNPRYDYETHLVRRGRALFGYVILKVYRDPVTARGSGDLVDLMWLDEDPESLAGVLRFARSRFHSLGVGVVSSWFHTNTVLDEIGRDEGFRPSGQERFFCGKLLDPACGELLDRRSWFLTMGDAELY